MSDKPLMEKLLKEHEIEIVISAVGGATILDQITLVEAITSVGTVKVNLLQQIKCVSLFYRERKN